MHPYTPRQWRNQNPKDILKYDRLEVSASLYEVQVPGSMKHRFRDYLTKEFSGMVKRTRKNVDGQDIAGMHACILPQPTKKQSADVLFDIDSVVSRDLCMVIYFFHLVHFSFI